MKVQSTEITLNAIRDVNMSLNEEADDVIDIILCVLIR